MESKLYFSNKNPFNEGRFLDTGQVMKGVL